LKLYVVNILKHSSQRWPKTKRKADKLIHVEYKTAVVFFVFFWGVVLFWVGIHHLSFTL